MDMDDGRTGDGDHRHRLIEDREHARNDALFHAKQHEAKQVWFNSKGNRGRGTSNETRVMKQCCRDGTRRMG